MVFFRDRLDAGGRLAEEISSSGRVFKNPIVLGIPRGGVTVGHPIAESLSAPLEPLTLGKLPLPQNDQMGFGAVTLDRKVILNEDLIEMGYIRRREIDPIVDEVYQEVLRRDRLYRGDRDFPDLKKRDIILVDDGLATGYTMLAAVKFAREKEAGEIVAAAPVAHAGAFRLVEEEVDEIFCLHVSTGPSFAVASFYMDFHDMRDSEVIETLRKSRGVESRPI